MSAYASSLNAATNGKPRTADPIIERGLPADIETERTIFGAVILENALMDDVVEVLGRDDFYLEVHRTIFSAMVRLHARKEPIDLVTLQNELRTMQQFEQVGGYTYISSLIDGVPRTDTVEHY